MLKSLSLSLWCHIICLNKFKYYLKFQVLNYLKLISIFFVLFISTYKVKKNKKSCFNKKKRVTK